MNSETDSEAYEHYVYVLMDPTANDEVFYVGKGSGRRMTAHEKEAAKWEPEEDEEESGNAKIDRINRITAAGHEVKKLMVGRYRTPEEAFAVEARQGFGTQHFAIRPGGPRQLLRRFLSC